MKDHIIYQANKKEDVDEFFKYFRELGLVWRSVGILVDQCPVYREGTMYYIYHQEEGCLTHCKTLPENYRLDPIISAYQLRRGWRGVDETVYHVTNKEDVNILFRYLISKGVKWGNGHDLNPEKTYYLIEGKYYHLHHNISKHL